MKRYSEYKDSGVKWIGEIPGHWKVNKIRSHFKERRVKVSDKDFQALSVAKIGVVPQLEDACKTDNGDNRKQVLKGDFVVNSRSDRKGSCGISPLDGSVSLINIVLRPFNILQGYVHYLFRSNNYIEEFYRNGRGIVADLWTTRYSEMRNIQIPLPPLSEQQAIVTYLASKVAKIDEYISIAEKKIAALEELKQTIIAEAVTRGIHKDVPMKYSGVKWIGMIPEYWKIRKMKFVFKERSEKGYPNEPILSATQSNGVIPQSMYENRVVVVNKGFENLKLVCKGDFVISLRSFQGGIEYAYYRGIISAAYTILTKSTGFLNEDYIKYLFKSHPFVQLLKTCVTGIREGQNINYSLLRDKYIPIPPLPEQQEIVTYIEAKVANINQLCQAERSQIEKLKEYKQRLISDVVTGKVKVTND